MSHRVALLTVALLAACSAGTPVATSRSTTPAPSATPSPSASAAPAAGPTPLPTRKPVAKPSAAPTVVSCPSYAAPDPHRPVVTAEVTVDGRTVTGTEQVVFTPDLPVTELVFRLWASAPTPAAKGGTSTLAAVRVNGTKRAFTRPSPTLVRVPWSGSEGVPITIDLAYSLVLPVGADDRDGNRGTTSWFASGIPLLAWERGRGWATEPATALFAEASTSEEVQLARLTVHHAAGLSVIATGRVLSRTATTTVSTAPTVRDVAVSVGAFRIVTLAGPVRVTVGVAPGLTDDPTTVAREVVRAMRVHVARFGPFPYEQLGIAVLPDIHGGIEYPGVILLGTGQDRDATASHETAHEWFYGLVGDDQARDPWLDEAFATYAEGLDRGTAKRYLAQAIPTTTTGKPMTYWTSRSGYFRSVYLGGAQALLRARARSPKAFDAQVRCYVARNAHRIATPADVAASILLAVSELRRKGAL